jgi:hypothetical protein
MTLRYGLLLTLLLAIVPAPGAAAAAPAKSGSAPTHERASARRAGAPARHAGAPVKHGGAGAKSAGGAGAGPRTLEDIHIEGEIPVPQVLFITARDQRRFLEFQHGRYLRTSRKLGEDTVLPSWIVVTGTRPAENRGSSR